MIPQCFQVVRGEAGRQEPSMLRLQAAPLLLALCLPLAASTDTLRTQLNCQGALSARPEVRCIKLTSCVPAISHAPALGNGDTT